VNTPLCLSALLLSATLAAGQAPTLKGHVIGETVQRFLEISPVLRSRVDLCRTDPDAVRRQDGDTDACANLLNAVDRGGDCLIEENRFNFLLKGAKQLDFAGYVEFSHGKLTILGVNFDGTWEDLGPDLLEKFGKPTTSDVIHMQNVYGATFSFPKAMWARPGYVVNAHEDMMAFGQIHFVQVEIVTASRMREIEAEEQKKKNSLD
jgi:hypothetical protein